ncbi:hypothetical protein LJC42_05435 [Eubacteriales bacterium OttesenSCG-928-K08]|nr:hypothetical protein [Eubacteriales bacterium OttesenSCG-928-K08]
MTKTQKRLALLLCAAILIGFVPFVPVARAATDGVVQASGEGVLNANRVNIRPAPSTKNTPLGKAGKGDVFRVTGFTIPSGFSQGFFQVSGESITGSAYIAANYLNVTFDAPPTGEITKKGYLYTAKSTSRKYRAESIAVGETLPLYAREGKWWRTELNGQTLWVRAANVLQVQGAAAPAAPTSGIQLTPSTTKTTYGSVGVSVSGVEGASFVGWRRHTPGATYTDKTGFANITASQRFAATANGWYAVGVVDANGQFRYELIQITNIEPYPSGGESAPIPKINVSFTALQTGGKINTTDSTGIILTFDQAVTGLTANDISITDGTGTVVAGALSGSGTTWTIALTSVTAQGNVTVSVADFGNYSISTGPRTVAVYMSNAVANTEAAKITNFATGTNTTSSLVFDPTITGGTLTTGAVVNLVEVKAGADAGSATALSGSSMTNAGVLSLNTQNTVDAANLSFVGVTFTVTINGVISDPVTLDINSLFGATTTAGKLRTDKANLTSGNNSAVTVTTVFTGDAQLDTPITMSQGVAMTETAADSKDLTGFKDVTIRADAGRPVTLKLNSPAPSGPSIMHFTGIPFVCDNTTYTYTEQFIVVVIAK